MKLYRKLLKLILGVIDKEYPDSNDGQIGIPKTPDNNPKGPENSEPNPDKGCESYRKWMGDHQYHLLAGAIFLIFGVYIYLYWDNIGRVFKRDDTGDDSPAFGVSSEGSIVSSEPSTIPRDYPEGYLRYFSRKMGDLSREVKDRAISLFNKNESRPIIPHDTPRGVYFEGGNQMWDGLPIPRVESTGDGREFFISLDTNGFIKIADNSREANMVDVINPNSGLSIGRQYISQIERVNIIASAKDHAYFESPENSYVRNPLSRMDNITITTPSVGNTSVEHTDLPTFDDVKFDPDNFEIGVPGPSNYKGKAPEVEMPNINFEESAFSNLDNTPKAKYLDLDKTPKAAPKELEFEEIDL